MKDTTPVKPVPLSAAPRGALLREFFDKLQPLNERIDEANVHRCMAVIVELRRRALERADVAGLRDVHTLTQEVNNAVMTARNNEQLSPSGRIVLPGARA